VILKEECVSQFVDENILQEENIQTRFVKAAARFLNAGFKIRELRKADT
jgi:hypothetical protein